MTAAKPDEIDAAYETALAAFARALDCIYNAAKETEEAGSGDR